MSKSIEKQGELLIETAPAKPDEVIRSVSTAAPEPVEQSPVETENRDALWEASAPPIVVHSEARPAVKETPIIVVQAATTRTRKWTRRVEDLPRGERWKRRLPEVCR